MTATECYQALALLINGDNKTGPLPAFKVSVVLGAKGKICLEPSFDEHRNALKGVADDILQFSVSLPKLADELTPVGLANGGGGGGGVGTVGGGLAFVRFTATVKEAADGGKYVVAISVS